MENNWKCKAPAFGNLGAAHRSPGQTQVNQMQWSNWSKKMELITTCSQALMQPLFLPLVRSAVVLVDHLLPLCITSEGCTGSVVALDRTFLSCVQATVHATIHATFMQQFMQLSMKQSMKQSVKQTVPNWKLATKSAKYLPRRKCRMLYGFEGKHWLEGHGALQSCNEPRWAHSHLRPPCFRDPSSLDWQTENISDAMFSKWRNVSINIMQCVSKTQLFQTRILFIWSFLKEGLKKMMSKLFSAASCCRAGWHLRRTRLMKNCQGTMWLLNKSSSSIHIAVRALYPLGAHHQCFQPFG